MACFHPIPGVLQIDPGGKRRLKLHVKEPTHWIPCGKCLGCMDTRAATWALRLKHESRSHSHSIFLTLTYDDEHEPAGLQKRDLQLFWKRLRKATPHTQLKYFACGEYGDRTKRPHYHAALFGYQTPADAKKWDTENYESQTLNTLWGNGRVLTSELTTHRMAYVTGYVLKKAGYKKQTYCDEDGVLLESPFQIPSTGLGRKWVERYGEDLRDGWAMSEGRKIGIPRYYSDRLKKDRPELADRIQAAKDIRRATLPDPDPARNRAALAIREQKVKEHRRDKV